MRRRRKKLIKYSRVSNELIEEAIKYFALEVPSLKASKILKVNRHTTDKLYNHIREKIVEHSNKQTPLGFGEHEVDESYFGGHRKGNRGRGAAGKVAVFGILKRNGKVFTTPVTDVTKKTLRQIIKQQVDEGSVIYSDSFKAYDGLITDGYKHYRINHAKEFARRKRNHINGIENFWGFAKTKLRRYNGVSRSKFFLYLKEMEFRFNHRNMELANIIKEIIKT